MLIQDNGIFLCDEEYVNIRIKKKILQKYNVTFRSPKRVSNFSTKNWIASIFVSFVNCQQNRGFNFKKMINM